MPRTSKVTRVGRQNFPNVIRRGFARRDERRTGELSGSSEAEVLAAILERDAKDQLVVDFMNPAPGVTLIDTTELDFAQSVQAVIDVVRAAEARA